MLPSARRFDEFRRSIATRSAASRRAHVDSKRSTTSSASSSPNDRASEYMAKDFCPQQKLRSLSGGLCLSCSSLILAENLLRCRGFPFSSICSARNLSREAAMGSRAFPRVDDAIDRRVAAQALVGAGAARAGEALVGDRFPQRGLARLEQRCRAIPLPGQERAGKASNSAARTSSRPHLRQLCVRDAREAIRPAVHVTDTSSRFSTSSTPSS